METNDQVTILISACVFITTFRLFKFLSISPVLVVPFEALVRSKNEIGAFIATLTLFMFAFAFFFTFMFGADMEEFNGLSVSMDTLFSAAFDAFDDGIYDRLDELDSVASFTGHMMIYVFVCLVTISFMNMLVTITMEFYSAEREKPESKDFLSANTKKIFRQKLRRFRRAKDNVRDTITAPGREMRMPFGRRPSTSTSAKDLLDHDAQVYSPYVHDTDAAVELEMSDVDEPGNRSLGRNSSRNRGTRGSTRPSRTRADSSLGVVQERTSLEGKGDAVEQEAAAAPQNERHGASWEGDAEEPPTRLPRRPTGQRLRFHESLIRDSTRNGEDLEDGSFTSEDR